MHRSTAMQSRDKNGLPSLMTCSYVIQLLQRWVCIPRQVGPQCVAMTMSSKSAMSSKSMVSSKSSSGTESMSGSESMLGSKSMTGSDLMSGSESTLGIECMMRVYLKGSQGLQAGRLLLSTSLAFGGQQVIHAAVTGTRPAARRIQDYSPHLTQLIRAHIKG